MYIYFTLMKLGRGSHPSRLPKKKQKLIGKKVRLIHLQCFDKGNRTDWPFCNFHFRRKDSPLQLQVDQRNFAAWVVLYLLVVEMRQDTEVFLKKLEA
jgi:hypothetical protein